MISRMRITAVLGAVVLLASACDSGDTPFSPTAKPAFDGGHTTGGNVVGTPGDSTSYGTFSATSTSAPGAGEPTDPIDEGGHTTGGN